MEMGFLGIPKTSSLHDPTGVVLLEQFHEYLHSDYANEVKADLLADDRVQGLLNRCITTGINFVQFDIDSLAKWYLWRINEVGYSLASEELSAYLNRDQTVIEATIWIAGVHVEEAYEISSGVYLVPIARMPYSREKAFYAYGNPISIHTVHVPRSSCALVIRLPIQRDFSIEQKEDVEFTRLFVSGTHAPLLKSVAIVSLMNLVSSSCAYQTGLNFYYPDNVPFGPFDPAWVSSVYPYEGTHVATVRLESSNIDDLKELLQVFTEKWKDEPDAINRALERFSLAKRRPQYEDKMLDLCISLEMLLLKDSGSKEQLSMTFRLRGAWLLGGTSEEKNKNMKLLRDLYNYRSSVAHGGAISDKKFWQDPLSKSQELFSLSELLIRKYIAVGKLTKDQWDVLVLGAPGIV